MYYFYYFTFQAAVNVAIGKPSRQSTTYRDWMNASLANDGNKNRVIDNDNQDLNSCSHTDGILDQPKRAWWQVDLLDTLEIARIAIVPRKLGTCIIICF